MIRGGDRKFDFAGVFAAATVTPSAKVKITCHYQQILINANKLKI
jgi:hypothetical protein